MNLHSAVILLSDRLCKYCIMMIRFYICVDSSQNVLFCPYKRLSFPCEKKKKKLSAPYYNAYRKSRRVFKSSKIAIERALNSDKAPGGNAADWSFPGKRDRPHSKCRPKTKYILTKCIGVT